MNRITNRSIASTYSISQFFTYTLTGQRSSMSDKTSDSSGHSPFVDTATYAYDSRDRLIQKAVTWQTFDSEAPSAVINYGYDANGT